MFSGKLSENVFKALGFVLQRNDVEIMLQSELKNLFSGIIRVCGLEFEMRRGDLLDISNIIQALQKWNLYRLFELHNDRVLLWFSFL